MARMRCPTKAAFAVASLVLFAGALHADTILFDPTGTGSAANAVTVAGFQDTPGSAAQFGTVPFSTGTTATGLTLFQSTISGFVDSNGNTVNVPGLNSTFRLVTAGAFQEQVKNTVTGTSANATFALGSTAGSGFTTTPGHENSFYLMVHPNLVTVPDTGAGFHLTGDGNIVILTGHVVPAPGLGNPTGINGSFSVPDLTNQGTLLDTVENPNHGPNTVVGNGSQQFFIQVDTADPKYFVTAPTFIPISTQTTLNFSQAIALDTTFGPESGSWFTGHGQANVGAVNGINGPDIELQSAPNGAFLVTPTPPGVPEPGTMLLMGLGLAGAGAGRWIRRRLARRA